MPSTPDPDVEAHAALEATTEGFCHVARPEPASLVFIACSKCAAVISLAESVRNLSGHPVCMDCGLLSLLG